MLLTQVGDHVKISLGNQSQLFRIGLIKDMIYIQDLRDPAAISALYYDGKEWRVYGTDLDYKIEFPPKILESLPPEIIKETAVRLNPTDLAKFCGVNRRFNSTLCAGDHLFWREKYIRDFGEVTKEVLDWKKEYQNKLLGNIYLFGSFREGRRDLTLSLFIGKEVAQVSGIGVKMISGGANHLVILDLEGDVWTLGENKYGQCGLSSKDFPMVDFPTKLNLPKARHVSAGSRHTIVILETLEVYGFGDNTSRQLGVDILSTNGWGLPPTLIPGLKAWSASAGDEYTVAIDIVGEVQVFGSNYEGRLGLPRTYRRVDRPMKLSLHPTGVLKAKKVAAGGGHTLLIDTEGIVWTFGRNNHGQLGRGPPEKSYTPTKISIPSRGQVKDVAAGLEHSMVLDTKGTVWVFGANSFRQLGFVDPGSKLSPTKVPLSTKAKAIAAGEFYSVILDIEGTVWFAGSSPWGRPAIFPFLKVPKIKARRVATGRNYLAVAGSWEGEPYTSPIV